MSYYYYYSDKPKTDINGIKDNKDNNKDFKALNNLISKNENNKDKSQLNIQDTFQFLIIEKIYLGFNSAYEIYNKYKTEFEKNVLEKKDSSHPSLLFEFSEDCCFYVDYLPDKGNSKNAQFVYKEKYGLRYCQKNYEDFIHHNDTCIILLKSDIKMNFKDFFLNICKNKKWDKESHDYLKHNCNDFIIESLQLLQAKRLNNNIESDFLFSCKINQSKKDAIKNKIPYSFHKILEINW